MNIIAFILVGIVALYGAVLYHFVITALIGKGITRLIALVVRLYAKLVVEKKDVTKAINIRSHTADFVAELDRWFEARIAFWLRIPANLCDRLVSVCGLMPKTQCVPIFA